LPWAMIGRPFRPTGYDRSALQAYADLERSALQACVRLERL
jgi:hypothetical protein